MENSRKILELLATDDFRLLPEKVMTVVTGDLATRNHIYSELISMHHGDLSYDWFQRLYEEEYAQRKELKQDFTPQQVSNLTARIAGNGTIHEPTAGSGGLVIAKWWNDMQGVLPWDYKPSLHMVDCWELSDRSLPFLLLNLSIRGMMGYVTHGDVLTMQVKRRYAILNRKDDPLAFSEIIEIGPNDTIGRKEK